MTWASWLGDTLWLPASVPVVYLLPGTSALRGRAWGVQGALLDRVAVTSALTGTVPQWYCPRTVPCLPGDLGWTSPREGPDSTGGLQGNNTQGKSCFFFFFLYLGILGEARCIDLSIRNKRDYGVHFIYYFSNFYYLVLILCHLCHSSCGLNSLYLLCPSLSGFMGTTITQTMTDSAPHWHFLQVHHMPGTLQLVGN